MDKIELIQKAIDAQKLAYTPYSHFNVGAALLTKSGEVYLGANIENAAYGCTMCGERNAVYNAKMHGVKKEDMVALAITADCPRPVSPCGQCRQVLSELFPLDAPIYLSNNKFEIKETCVKELLPYEFLESDMK